MGRKSICGAVIGVIICVVLLFTLSACSKSEEEVYRQAVQDYKKGYYADAISGFMSLGDYNNSQEYLRETFTFLQDVYYGFSSYDIVDANLSAGDKNPYYTKYRIYDYTGDDQMSQRIYHSKHINSKHSDPVVEMDIPYTIEDDGTLDIMGGYSQYFIDILPEGANEKEHIRLIPYKYYIIEKRSIFNGKIPEDSIDKNTFDAEFSRGDEKYIFNSDGTFYYSGWYAGFDKEHVGTYVRLNDFIILSYKSGLRTRGLLIYRDMIVDRGLHWGS